ncbi:Alba domain containing protein [Trichuris trichiura]|uniref:Alba domain containing protein n=1 Tax=Trichuris trichiura TaxID=36087 RepID=A0A077YW14_TRITR|nr:Alba domain containing protein [Trichuris trichiura]
MEELNPKDDKALENLILLYPFLSSKEIAVVKVKSSSSVKNLVRFAKEALTGAERRKVVFVGIGSACSRAISCVEGLKRELSMKNVTIHQRTKISFDNSVSGSSKEDKSIWSSFARGPISKPKAALSQTASSFDVESIYLLTSLDPLPEEDTADLSGVHQSVVASGKRQVNSSRLMETPANPWKRVKQTSAP